MPVVNGTTYHDTTPKGVIDILERARKNRWRLRIHLGDPKKGIAWTGDADEGYIGRSTGRVKIPLVMHNSRSLGGPALLDHCILRIEHSNRKRGGVLYECQSAKKPDPKQKHTPHDYRRAAAEIVGTEADLDIDDDAKVSMGRNGGAYVAVWLYVSDADVEENCPPR